MTIHRWATASILAALGTGCVHGNRSSPTKQPVSTQQPAAGETAADATTKHCDIMVASGTPNTVVFRLEMAIRRRFDLPVQPRGAGFRNGNLFSPDPHHMGDYFSASFSASTVRGETIEVSGEWIADGRVRVTVASDLPDVQHAAVLAELRHELAHPATDPSDGG